jgi:20S proteasome subunit alpha 7
MVQGYYGVAVGKGRQAAKTELEKLKWGDMTCREAIKAIAKMYV